MPPNTESTGAPDVALNEEESKLFYQKLKRHLMARNRLDELNAEAKTLRDFLKSNGNELASFIEKKKLKSCRAEGANVRTIHKTIKVKPSADNVYEAIAEMYGNKDMVEQVKTHVFEKYVQPKQKTQTVLKIVKLRPKTAKSGAAPNPNPQPRQ